VKRLYFVVASLIFAPFITKAQTFEPQDIDLPIAFTARQFWVDFDGDGDMDVLQTGFSREATLNTRNGNSFTPEVLDFADVYFASTDYFKLNDFDHDGDVDILGTARNTVVIMVNDGGSFTPQTISGITIGDYEGAPLQWQDVDGDMDLDIMHGRNIFLNNNGTYLASIYKLPEVRRPVWGDINNDGLVDILATVGWDQYNGNALHVFLNQGTGHFADSGEIGTLLVRDPAPLVLFDANNDGKPDILTHDYTTQRAVVLRNISTTDAPLFSAPFQLTHTMITHASTGDLGGDGIADLVMSGYSFDEEPYGYKTFVFKNTSSGATLSFAKTHTMPGTEWMNSLQIIDFNADEVPDIHLAMFDLNSYDGINQIYLTTGITPGPAPAIPTGLAAAVGTDVQFTWAGTPAVAYNIELKQSGKFMRANPTNASGNLLLPDNSLLLNTPTFAAKNLPAGVYEWRVQAIDKSDRASAYSSPETFEISAAPSALTLQVLTQTSVKLCWSYPTAGSPSFVIFRRTEGAEFIEFAVPAGTSCYTDASLEKDVTYEYFVKAVVADAHSAPSHVVTYRSSLFVATPFGKISPNIISASCVPGDFDLDGDYDLEFMGRIDYNFGADLLFRNDGTGAYPELTSLFPTLPYEYSFNSFLDARDMDNDGDIDVVAILGHDYSTGRLSILVNEDGKFKLGFQTPPYLGTYAGAVADFNNDGRQDILYRHAVGNASGNPNVYELLLQKTDGSFINSKFSFTPDDYGDIGYFKVVDINSDGFVDICFTGNDSPLRFFINDGGMTFTEQLPAPAIPSRYDIAFFDVDGDHIMDYISTSSAFDGISWFKGSGNLQFTEQQNLFQSYFYNTPSLKMADVNGDGSRDVLVTDGYRSAVLMSNGNGSFEDEPVELEANSGSHLVLTDRDNDGNLDIVKLGNDGQHQGQNYFYDNQSAKFGVVNANPSTPPGLTATLSVGALDISWQPSTDDKTPVKELTYNLWIKDGTGKTWLHGESDEAGTFRTRLAPGNAGFRTSYQMRDLPAGTYKIRVQSVDAAYASSPWSSEFTVTIVAGPTNLQVERVLLNKVSLTWTGSAFAEKKVLLERKSVESEFETVAELPPGTVHFVDEDLPYHKHYQYRVTEVSDAITTATSNVVEWSTLMWIAKETTLPNIHYTSLDVADFTNDGKMDMLMNGARLYGGEYFDMTRATFENQGSGTFKRTEITPSQLTHTAKFQFFDVDGDHKLDLYQHGYVWADGYLTETFINNGDKTFTPVNNMFTQDVYGLDVGADIDMDNDLDLLAFSLINDTYGVRRYLRNDSPGNYTALDASSPCGAPCSTVVVSADFDLDGDEDFISRSSDYSNTYMLYLQGPEQPVFSGISFNAYEHQIASLDYNGDGLIDIAVLSNSYYHKGKLYKNLGLVNGSLEFELVRGDLPNGENTINVADFDHDGKQDIALVSPVGMIYRSTGDDTFESYKIPFYNFWSVAARTIDFDNDGDLDIYVMGYINHYGSASDQPFSRVFYNQIIDAGNGTGNNAPAAPTNLIAQQDSLGMNLTWANGVDDHTPGEAMTHDVILYRQDKAYLKASVDPVTGSRQRLEAGRYTHKALLNNLKYGGTYTWRVQAVDQSYKGSPLSAEGTFTFLPPPPQMKDTVIYRCGRGVTLTADGTNIKWYRDRQKTQLLASGAFHPTESQVVYVTQEVDGFEGLPKHVSITIYDTPPVPVTQPDAAYCENYTGYLALQAEGNSLRWYSDAERKSKIGEGPYVTVITGPRTYYVTQTIGGCESASAQINVSKIVIDSDIVLNGNTLEVDEKDGDYYAWYKDNSFLSGGTSVPYHGEVASFFVYIQKRGCLEQSKIYNMPDDVVTGIDGDLDSDWSIYPNPAEGRFTIDVAPSLRGTINIYDVTGKMIFTRKINSGENEPLKALRLPKGIYVVVLEEAAGTSTKRVVVY
jgi:hypothetical protein